MRVIRYKPRYLQQVLELNKKLVQQWFVLEGDRRKKSTWDMLTPKMRFLHGGPWNDPITLKIHLKHFLSIGELLLLLDDSDHILGIIEYHIDKEIFHIDWMMIDPNYHMQGLGSKLLDICKEKLRKSNKIHSIWTEPEDYVERFYVKNKFELVTPYYFRYKFEKIRDPSQPTDWQELSPRSLISPEKNHGEANNTFSYLKMLCKTSIEYADLFEEPYPLAVLEKRDNVMWRRNLPAMPHRVSIWTNNAEFLPRNPKQFEIFQSQRSYYFTQVGELTSSYWKEFRIIKRLEFNP